jgi:hypothetical protein
MTAAAAIPDYVGGKRYTAEGKPIVDGYEGGEGNATIVVFKPVGPVARRFINDRKFISSIMGPYGSAKTTSCFQKILNAALWQNPQADGSRKIRVCCVRATYAQLQTNVMKDWFSWFPKTRDNWNEQRMTHNVRIDFPGIGIVEIEMLFRALEHYTKPEEVFKGMALTLLWLNEVDTLSMQVLKFGMPRVGRYPAAKDGGCVWSGIIADFNAPDIDNWVYDFLVNKNFDMPEELIEQIQAAYGSEFGISFHQQPGGRSPEAENLDNLPPGYYDRLLIGFNDNEKRRFVDNKFGAVMNGQPVFPEYNDDFHRGDEVAPIPGLRINIGLDGGMTPAAVFFQEGDDGQIRVLDELVVMAANDNETLQRLGVTNFATECRAFFDRQYPRYLVGEIWGDPAGFDGGDDEDLAWMQKFGKVFGKKVRKAPVSGNRLTPRLEAVRKCLTSNVGSKPGMLISSRCKKLRQGFNNGYVLIRVKFSNGSGLTKNEPLKNDFSHVHDALQYGVLGVRKRGNASDEIDRQAAARRQRDQVNYGGGYFSRRGPEPEPAPARKAKRGRY